MAFKFAEKRKTIQEEIAYIVYMIVGSYFNKTLCCNQLVVDRLYLYYMEMKQAAQEKKENKIIALADKILKDYDNILRVMNCEVMIEFKNNKYFLEFITGFERVHAEVDSKGNCEMEIWEK